MGATKAPKLEFSRVARGRLDGKWPLSVLTHRFGPGRRMYSWVGRRGQPPEPTWRPL